MNQRIRELTEQAGLKHHNWITNESNITDSDFKYPRLEDYEKFAELIIQECAAVAGKFVHDNKYKQEGISEFWLKDSIKEHFGVE